MNALLVLVAFIADSGPWLALTGTVSGIAALITAVVGWQVYRDKKSQKTKGNRIDLLQVGQESLEKALQRADMENATLRGRLEEMEAHIDLQDAEILSLKEQVLHLEHELERYRK